ncbi:MAG: YaaL family protein [Bacilli bacterium]
MDDLDMLGKKNGYSERQNEELLEEIGIAHKAWELAMQQFNNAVDPNVVDDAVYLLNAAEMRYEGLMRVARRLRLSVDFEGMVQPFAKRRPGIAPSAPVQLPKRPGM